MPNICKVCDEPATPASPWADDVCDDCTRYDWGHWHWKTANLYGALAGFFVAYAAWSAWASGEPYVHGWALALFAAGGGAATGYALAAVVTDRVLNGILLSAPPSERPEDRAREAEKFFYISLLAAYQGKIRFAVRMLEAAERHGWASWGRLTGDPRLGHFSRLDRVRRITG